MRNNNTTTVIWIAIVLASAVGLGYGIRHIRWSLTTEKNLGESKSQPQGIAGEPEAEIVPTTEPKVDVVEIDTTTIEEPVWEEPEDELQSQPSQKARNSGPTSHG